MKRTLTAMFLSALAGCGSAQESQATDAGVILPVEPPPVTRVEPVCPEGTTWCGASCEDLQTSLGSCGHCNLHCPHTMHCVQGTCVDR